MTKLELVKSYYDKGLWDIRRVSDAVTKNWITEQEYCYITGQPYVGGE